MNQQTLERDQIAADQWISEIEQDDFQGICDKYIDSLPASVRDDELRTVLYMMYREQGVAHTWAEMSACRQASGSLNTNRTFNENARRRMGRMGWMLDQVLDKAHGAGINTQGKVHCTQLGPPHDPGAWVSGTDDIMTIAKERNLTVQGHVKHQGTVMPPRQPQLADDLVDQMCEQEMRADPAVAEQCAKSQKNLRHLRGAVREKYGRQK